MASNMDSKIVNETSGDTHSFVSINGGVSVSQAEEEFHKLEKELSQKSQEQVYKTFSKKSVVHDDEKVC